MCTLFNCDEFNMRHCMDTCRKCQHHTCDNCNHKKNGRCNGNEGDTINK